MEKAEVKIMKCNEYRNMLLEGLESEDLSNHILECKECAAYKSNLDLFKSVCKTNEKDVPSSLDGKIISYASGRNFRLRKRMVLRIASAAIAASIAICAVASFYLSNIEDSSSPSYQEIEQVLDKMYSYNDYQAFNKRLNTAVTPVANQSSLELAMEQTFLVR